MTWEGLDLRMRPFVSVSVRNKLIRLLIKALMGASYTAGF
jgi:hypothetical protein